jgi:hypothetical protein
MEAVGDIDDPAIALAQYVDLICSGGCPPNLDDIEAFIRPYLPPDGTVPEATTAGWFAELSLRVITRLRETTKVDRSGDLNARLGFALGLHVGLLEARAHLAQHAIRGREVISGSSKGGRATRDHHRPDAQRHDEHARAARRVS